MKRRGTPTAIKTSAQHIPASSFRLESISDEDLLRGFLLSLGASGRRIKTLVTYEESILQLSEFGSALRLPGLAEMDRNVVRHFLTSLYDKGNKPATVSVRYRALRRFFGWCVREGERADNPMDLIDPPSIPDEIQPYYTADEVRQVLKAMGKKRTLHQYRDRAIVLTLYDAGVRAAELIGMRGEDVDWRELSILVTGKSGNQRRVGIGHKTAEAIERYSRRRQTGSSYLWLASGIKPFTNNGLRMMLARRFADAGLAFRGAHAFRRSWAMSFLEAGGALDDLKELGGWKNYAMVSRYARASAGERAVKSHKKYSPGDKLDIR